MSECENAYDFEQVQLDELIEVLDMEFAANDFAPTLVLGLAGIGKTQSIKEYAKANGIGYKAVRLVYLDPTDMNGLPYIEDITNGKTVNGNAEKKSSFATPGIMPDVAVDGQRGIFVIDEITSASQEVRATAYQMLESEAQMGTHVMPKEWKVVALGNGPDDGGIFRGLEPTIISRCNCFRLLPDVKEWINWAGGHGIDPSIISFLKVNPDDFVKPAPEDAPNQFPTARTWDKLSSNLNVLKLRFSNAPGGMGSNKALRYLAILSGGAIGPTEAAKFTTHYMYQFGADMIAPDDIFSGKVKAFKTNTKRDVTFIIESNCVQQAVHKVIKEDDYKQKFAALFTFVMNEKSTTDLAIQCIGDIMAFMIDKADKAKFTEMAISAGFDTICPGWKAFISKNHVIFEN